MSKNIFLLMGSFCLPLLLISQVTMVTQINGNGIVTKEQLWNVLISNNETEPKSLILQLSVKDVLTGQPVLEAVTGKFLMGKGSKMFSNKSLQPISYNLLTPEFSNSYFPCGSYAMYYRLLRETGEGEALVAEEIVPVNIIPVTPPLLITPADQSFTESGRPRFTWLPPAPSQIFMPLSYDFTLVEILEGQVAKEALQYNNPVYINTGLQVASEIMPSGFDKLQKGKKYAWQVVARNNANCVALSDIWEFSTDTVPAIQKFIDEAPYTKMAKNIPLKGISPDGILKASYLNETGEPKKTIQVYQLSNPSQMLYAFSVDLKPGENLIQYDLKKHLDMKEGEMYRAVIVNNRGERWTMQFQVSFYKAKK